MNSEQYARLCDLFTQSSEIPSDQLPAFLDEHCGDDAELRAELLKMLRHDRSSMMLLDDDSHIDPPPAERPMVPGYEVRGILGRGGMGTVWRALHLATSREVALKVVESNRLFSAKARSRFEREVQLCAALNDPNIAQIYDSGTTDGLAFYSMELVEGTPIDHYIQEHEVTLRERIDLMKRACRAIEHAHQRGVIHRDLKPSNILVTADGTPHIVDFGLAKSAFDSDQNELVSLTGEILGTPAYMSPEQAAGQTEQLDTRSDVYSLGVILYQLVTGNMPHDTSGSIHSVLRRIATEDARLPREFARKIDRDLEAILLKSLAKQKNDRYSSAGDFAADIERFLAGRPISARSPSLDYFVSKWIRSHVLLTTFICTALLATVIGTAAILIVMQRHTTQAEQMADEAKRQREAAELQRQAAERQRENSEQLSYELGIQLASAEIANHSFRRAVSLLEALPPERRGWEWHYLHGQSTPHDRSTWRTALPQLEGVLEMSVSPDGRTLAIATGINTIEQAKDPHILLLDAQSGAIMRRLEGHADGIFAVCFSPDGQQLYSGGRDLTLRRWDVKTGELLETVMPRLELDGQQVALFPFEIVVTERFAAISAHPAGLLVAELPQRSEPWPLSELMSLAKVVVSMTGERGQITIDSQQQHLVWTTLTWIENVGHLYVVDLNDRSVIGHMTTPPGNPFTDSDVSPDGRRIATASFDGAAAIWDTETLERLQQLRGHEGLIYGIQFTRDAQHIVTIGVDETIRLWELSTGQTLDAFFPSSDATGIMLRNNPERLAAFTVQNPGMTVRRWELTPEPKDASILMRHEGKVRDSAVDSGGRYVASVGEDGFIRLLDLASRKVLWTANDGKQYATAVAFSPDGHELAVGRSNNPNAAQPPFGELRFYATETGQPLREPLELNQWVWDLQYDPSGQLLAIGTGEPGNVDDRRLGEAKVLDLATYEIQTDVRTLGRRCRGVTFGPHGKTLITASESELAIWDRSNGQLIAADVAEQGRNFATLHNGQIVTGNRGRIEFREFPSLRLISTFAHDRYVNERLGYANVAEASFTPDGKRMATGAWNNILTIWDCDTGQSVFTFPAHAAGIHHVQFTPDGQTIISSSHDGTVRYWQSQE